MRNIDWNLLRLVLRLNKSIQAIRTQFFGENIFSASGCVLLWKRVVLHLIHLVTFSMKGGGAKSALAEWNKSLIIFWPALNVAVSNLIRPPERLPDTTFSVFSVCGYIRYPVGIHQEELFSCVKLQKGWVDWKMSPESPSTKSGE